MERAVVLLPKNEQERKSWKLLTWGEVVDELKKVSCLAAPLVVVAMTLILLEVVSLMMAGHLSELSLSAVSIAISFTNVTGFTLIIGLAGGLETLCGQAYGAGQYQKFGSYTYCAIMCLLPICIPISVLWIFMDKILIAIGMDSDVSIVACEYATWLIPALFANAILQPLLRFYQSQSLILPLLLSNCATLSFHIPLCWALVYKWELGSIGAAFAIGLSYWFNVICLALYMWLSSSCEKTRIACWNDVFASVNEFLRIAVPSALMLCLEWCTFELLLLLAVLLPDSQLETSVLSICLATVSLNYYVQYGFSVAASTRVSNELGAGNPQAARVAVRIILIISLTEATMVSIALFFSRRIFGYIFSNEKEVVDFVTEVAPLLCLSIIMDSLQIVLSGVVRGCGWQHIGAYVNLGAYNLVGAPVAILLCFVVQLRGKGLWIGILTGTTVQATSFAVITALINWQKQMTVLVTQVCCCFASYQWKWDATDRTNEAV